MISYDLDPSLHTSEPEPEQIDDGFSRPHHGTGEEAPAARAKGEPVLPEKSDF